MNPLNEEYQKRLEQIAQQIQGSEEYAKYLDEEEEEDYQSLRELIEPNINNLYNEVAAAFPLQLIALEEALLDEKFEGMFLPRILGYSILRGQVNEEYKYYRPQQHFKKILRAICQSSNFDVIRKRIGQTIQTGFALSSDIWITSLINEIANKRIRYFLQSQKLTKFRVEKERRIGYLRYRNQFKKEIYHTAKFPANLQELKTEFRSVKSFIQQRIKYNGDNSTLIPEIKKFLDNEEFQKTDEYVEILGLYGFFFEMNEADAAHFKTVFNKVRKENPDFSELWMNLILELQESDIDLDGAADKRLMQYLDTSINDELTQLYALIGEIHTKGYVHEDAIESIRVAYPQHEGLSKFNKCIRKTILNYFSRFMKNLDVTSYSDYFELSKIFPVYIELFGNQQFNQHIKDLCMTYVKRGLLKKYTDKRGKDYQDIKKFVSTNFRDLGFLKDKEIVELFKTRRKKKKPV